MRLAAFTEDDEALLRSTQVAQQALYVAGVACARALIARGVVPDAVAGHSIGSYGAAVVAGACSRPRARKARVRPAGWMSSCLRTRR